MSSSLARNFFRFVSFNIPGLMKSYQNLSGLSRLGLPFLFSVKLPRIHAYKLLMRVMLLNARVLVAVVVGENRELGVSDVDYRRA